MQTMQANSGSPSYSIKKSSLRNRNMMVRSVDHDASGHQQSTHSTAIRAALAGVKQTRLSLNEHPLTDHETSPKMNNTSRAAKEASPFSKA